MKRGEGLREGVAQREGLEVESDEPVRVYSRRSVVRLSSRGVTCRVDAMRCDVSRLLYTVIAHIGMSLLKVH